MQLSLRRIEDQNIYYQESGEDSSIQLVFIPGAFNAEIWKHQINYFSKNYKTAVFEPLQRRKDYEGVKKALESIISQEVMDKVVLVSDITSNSIVQELESHENVKATFMTGRYSKPDIPSRTFYKIIWSSLIREPKLLRRTLFSECTRYNVLKEFSEDVVVPKHDIMKSFLERHELSRPEKPSATVYSTEDRFSSLKSIRNLQDDHSIRVIERAGTYSFYEKPEEYNKALNDFLTKVKKSIEKNEVEKARDKNRSLTEFEKKKVAIKR